MRTRLEVRANKIDRDIFNLIGNLESFLTDVDQSGEREIAETLRRLRRVRVPIRRLMHPLDREITK